MDAGGADVRFFSLRALLMTWGRCRWLLLHRMTLYSQHLAGLSRRTGRTIMDRCFRNRLLRTSLFGCVLAIGGVVAAPAQSLQVLHSFAGCVVDPDSGLCSGDGSHPDGALTQAGDGNFYGTTVGGIGLAVAEGLIYRISPSGSEEVVFQFPAS